MIFLYFANIYYCHLGQRLARYSSSKLKFVSGVVVELLRCRLGGGPAATCSRGFNVPHYYLAPTLEWPLRHDSSYAFHIAKERAQVIDGSDNDPDSFGPAAPPWWVPTAQLYGIFQECQTLSKPFSPLPRDVCSKAPQRAQITGSIAPSSSY